MKKFSIPIFALILAVVAGCGGGGGGSDLDGEVSGNIVDFDGNPIRGANVNIDNRNTTTNSSGAFIVTGVRPGTWALKAELAIDGLSYSGQTVVQVFEGERTKNANISVVRQDQQSTLYGVVRDRFGNVLQGAKVFGFAVNPDGFTLSSVVDVTNGLGEYELKSLAAGYTYRVNASGRGFNSDRDEVVLTAGERRRFDFALGDATDPLLSPPQNLVAVAWTSPDETTRSNQQARAIEQIKRLSDPRRVQRLRPESRTTLTGYNVEVDLYFDPPTSSLQSLLGYGIYRATTSNGSSSPVDFMRDPEASFYADIDEGLREDRNYYYEVTSLNVNYPNTGNSESDFSNRYGVRTLDDMRSLLPTFGPLTFRWQTVAGAEGYRVFLFDSYPDIGVEPLWSNSSLATGSSVIYNGPSLVSGNRYYYVVLGLANDDDSRTISRVEEFIAN